VDEMHKRKHIFSLLPLLLLIGLLATGCNSPSNKTINSSEKGKEGEKIVLKFADYFPNTHFSSVNGTQAWVEKVEELTEGKVEIKFFPGEQLGKGADTLDLVRTGAADIGNVSQGYVSGSMQLSSVVSLPGLMDNEKQSTKAAFELISSSPVLDEDFLKNGVRPILAFTSTSYEFWTTEKPIKSVQDLKGLKIRTSGGSANFHIDAIGATPASISAPEQYEALERNTIDGTLFTITSIPSYNLNEVVQYATLGASGGPNLGFVFINEEVWKSIPQDIQDKMIEASEIIMEEYSTKSEKEAQRILKEYKSSGDIEFIEVDEEEFKEAASSVEGDWIKNMESKGLPAQETVDVYKKSLEKYLQ
jgi:TRAP-type transport system periplasmic protein